MFAKNHKCLLAAAVALFLASLAGAAQAGDFNPSGTWTGSWKNEIGGVVQSGSNSKISLSWDPRTGQAGGNWEGHAFSDVEVDRDRIKWNECFGGHFFTVTAYIGSQNHMDVSFYIFRATADGKKVNGDWIGTGAGTFDR